MVRANTLWQLVGCLALAALGIVVFIRILSNRPEIPAVQDYVRVVRVAPSKQNSGEVYDYPNPSKTVPPVRGEIPVSTIDESSSEEAYMRNCLTALTREGNPEIMQISEASRAEMCTDPRRK